jgi:hypothetical protein
LLLGGASAIARAASPGIGGNSAAASAVYRGRWTSQTTGHSGPMRARITPRGDGTYDARFTGRFAVIVPFTYRVTLSQADSGEGGELLVAHKRLGPLMGSYEMSAWKSPAALAGSFSAAGDVGSVQLPRVR